jgi:hypothetical protein
MHLVLAHPVTELSSPDGERRDWLMRKNEKQVHAEGGHRDNSQEHQADDSAECPLASVARDER